MPDYWNQKGIPHKGWTLIDVIDIREDGKTEAETDYETCMMCGNDKIRYVHTVENPEVDYQLRVGCVCAGKMTDDYKNAEKRERKLRNKANRRTNWIKKEWEKSKNGNFYLNKDDHHLLIYKDRKTKKYKVKIGEIFGNKSFDTLHKAKIAVFNGIEYFKDKDEW